MTVHLRNLIVFGGLATLLLLGQSCGVQQEKITPANADDRNEVTNDEGYSASQEDLNFADRGILGAFPQATTQKNSAGALSCFSWRLSFSSINGSQKPVTIFSSSDSSNSNGAGSKSILRINRKDYDQIDYTRSILGGCAGILRGALGTPSVVNITKYRMDGSMGYQTTIELKGGVRSAPRLPAGLPLRRGGLFGAQGGSINSEWRAEIPERVLRAGTYDLSYGSHTIRLQVSP